MEVVVVKELGGSTFAAALAWVLTVSVALACFASTDMCKGYAVNREYDKAIEECSKQITGEIPVRYPEYSYCNRGAAYAAKMQYDEAISDYCKAIELNPGYVTAYINRAIAYAKKKQYDLAISDYSKAVELSRENPDAYIGRATAYANKELYDKAIADFNKAIELSPENATAYHNRAIVFAKKKDYDLADSDFNKAVDLSVPPSPPAVEHAAPSSSSPAVPARVTSTNPLGKAVYHVQLGVFKDGKKAAALSKKFKHKGYETYVMKSHGKGKGTLYRVLIGNFKDRQSAVKLAAEIKKKEKVTPEIYSG